MNKLFLVCLLLSVVAECISAIDLCAELKCGTDQSSDACASLSCPQLPQNIVATNATSTTDQPADTSKSTTPSNYVWPSYPDNVVPETYPLDYPFVSDGFPFQFQGNYPPPYSPYGDFQPFQPFQPFQYPFY